ncbi:MAG: RNA-binding S4 domain-containing protein, partial [Clostridiales bacterium]
LAQFLKWCGVAEHGGMAKGLVRQGTIQVNGIICLIPGKQLQEGDQVTAQGETWILQQENPAE